MSILILAFVFVISLAIVTTKGNRRLLLLLCGLFFTYDCVRVCRSPDISAYTTMILCFLLSLWKHGELKANWKTYPLRWVTIAISIVVFLVGLLDNRLNFVSSFSRPFKDICESYLCFFIGYASIKSLSDWEKSQEYLWNIFTFVGIWGLITFVLQNNPWYDYVTSMYGNEVGIWSEVQTRGYRVSSFLSNPIVYGFVVGVILINRTVEKIKGVYWAVALLFVANIVLSNSRTSYAAVAIAFVIMYVLRYRFSVKAAFAMFVLFGLSTVAYFNIEPFKNMIDLMSDLVLTGGANAGGSTTELKELQWVASMYYYVQAPWFGNGLAYFGEVSMEGGGGMSEDLAGMEGYVYKLLIEYGGVMIAAVLAFWSRTLWMYARYKKVNAPLSIVSISIVLSFLFFICATGTYGSVFVYTSIILGMNLKCLQTLSKESKHTPA